MWSARGWVLERATTQGRHTKGDQLFPPRPETLRPVWRSGRSPSPPQIYREEKLAAGFHASPSLAPTRCPPTASDRGAFARFGRTQQAKALRLGTSGRRSK